MTLLINLLVAVIVIGLLFYLVSMLPIEAKLQQMVRVVLVVICLIYLVQLLLYPGGGFHIHGR